MKWGITGDRASGVRKSPILYLFLAGMAAGIIGSCLVQGQDAAESGIFDAELLYRMKGMEVEEAHFLKYVLASRLKAVLLPAVLATTYLGGIAARLHAFGYGAMTGSVLSGAAAQYGLKGVVLFFAGILPQYLLYVPAGYWLLQWCLKVCREIYFEKVIRGEVKQWLILRLLQLAGIIAVVITGCLLESYVNPTIIGKMLLKF